MLTRQIESLVKDATYLESVGGRDAAALSRISSMVRKELLSGGPLNIISTALGLIVSDSAVQRLLDIVNFCSEHYQVEDRTLSAVVVPICIRIKGLMDAKLSIGTAERGALKELATEMADTLGARQVVFDTRLYSSESLSSIKVPDLRAYLMQLENGVLYPTGGPSVLTLCPQSDAQWHLAYFLGVAVIDNNKYPCLNDWSAQLQSHKWMDLPSAAIEQSYDVLSSDDFHVEAQCQGFFYLMNGLDEGNKGLRALRISAMLEPLKLNGVGMHIFCSLDPLRSRIKMLVACQTMTLEHQWKLFLQESPRDFQQILIKIASNIFNDFDPHCVEILDNDSYALKAKKYQVPALRLLGKRT